MRIGSAVFMLALAMVSGCAHQLATTPAALRPTQASAPEGKVALTVEAGDHRRWRVLVGGEQVCTTPCTGQLDAHDGFAVESDTGDGLYVRALPPAAIAARRAVVIPEGRHRGKYVNGVVFTSLGGMGLVTGITLTAVGCTDLEDRGGMCTAGLITGAVSAPLTAFAIWLLVDSYPKLHIVPVPGAPPQSPAASLVVTPTSVGLAGTF